MTITESTTPTLEDLAVENEALREELEGLRTAVRISSAVLNDMTEDGDEYPDREILGVAIPGALAQEVDEVILETVKLRMAAEPLVNRAEVVAMKVEAIGVDLVKSLRDVITDSGQGDDIDGSIHAIVDELTERRRMAGVVYNLGTMFTEAEL